MMDVYIGYITLPTPIVTGGGRGGEGGLNVIFGQILPPISLIMFDFCKGLT